MTELMGPFWPWQRALPRRVQWRLPRSAPQPEGKDSETGNDLEKLRPGERDHTGTSEGSSSEKII